MHNMVYLIGRLTEDPCIKKLEDDRDMLTINLAVQRSFKNEDNIYETDYLRCILWNALAEHTCEYCRKGDLVGIKGFGLSKSRSHARSGKPVQPGKSSFIRTGRRVAKSINTH